MIRYEDIAEALTSYLPEANLGLVQRAYLYSSKVHAGQTRKSGEPYLVHPLEVAYLLTELRLDEESIVTGLLHDTVEDTPGVARRHQEHVWCRSRLDGRWCDQALVDPLRYR